MSINVTSTTDSPEAVLAAQGGAVEPKAEAVETKPAPESTPAETLSASEPENETDEPEGDEPTESAEGKPKNKLQKRMSKLTRQREDARKEAEYWKAEALKQKPEPQAETPAPVHDNSKRPVADKFDTHELYVEALADWKVEQRLSERDAKQKQESVKSAQETKLKTFLDKRESFAEKHDDFFERMDGVSKIPMSITVNESLLESDNGPELLYELAKDPAEYARINALPAIAAARELGKFEARLSGSTPAKTETKTTKAPRPTSPIGSGKTTSTKSLDEMDFQEYKKAREAGRTA